MSTAAPGGAIWEDLDRQLEREAAGEDGIWANLKETANVSNYQPAQASGVVYRQLESQREGTYYMLNNPHVGTYLKLDERDFYVWSLMDGSRSIKQLVVAYFSRFGSIAFGRVTDLVAQLKADSFLSDPPIDLYREAAMQCRRGTPGYWGDKIWRGFLQKEMAIGGMDGILTTLYRRIIWVFYSKPALLLYPFMSIAGLGMFLYTVQAGTYPLLRTGGDLILGLVTFLVANVITVAVHEAAHAFTTKHYERKVRRGGVMIYFGSPAFFVDTMDIWMEPKKARIAVSWAGPYSGLILGSLCMFIIAATGFSDMSLNPLLFKMALWAFVFGALTNLNPLLEWDGYFILMDWLELPMLRKRSMDFVRRNLLNKLTSRSSFSREEKIFAIFGVMAVLYTVGMIGFGLFFWQSRVSSVLNYAGGWVFWLLIGLIAVVIGIPLVLGVGVLAYRAAQRARLWTYHRFLMGRPGHQVAALVTAGIAVAIPAAVLGETASDTYLAACGGLALATALISSVRVAPLVCGFSITMVLSGPSMADCSAAHRLGAQPFRRVGKRLGRRAGIWSPHRHAPCSGLPIAHPPLLHRYGASRSMGAYGSRGGGPGGRRGGSSLLHRCWCRPLLQWPVTTGTRAACRRPVSPSPQFAFTAPGTPGRSGSGGDNRCGEVELRHSLSRGWQPGAVHPGPWQTCPAGPGGAVQRRIGLGSRSRHLYQERPPYRYRRRQPFWRERKLTRRRCPICSRSSPI